MSSKSISIVFLAHNEAETIEKAIKNFFCEIGTKIPLKIIVAEDGSTDATKELLLRLSQKVPIKIVTGKEKKGYMQATKDVLGQVKSDLVFVTDSDGQFIAQDFWKLYANKDAYDMIVGWKVNRADSIWRSVIAKTFHSWIRVLFGFPLHDPNTAYRLLKKEVLDGTADETRFLKYSFWTEFSVRAFKKGYKITEVPINHRKRLNGSTHIYKIRRFPILLATQLSGLFKLWRELRNN